MCDIHRYFTGSKFIKEKRNGDYKYLLSCHRRNVLTQIDVKFSPVPLILSRSKSFVEGRKSPVKIVAKRSGKWVTGALSF